MKLVLTFLIIMVGLKSQALACPDLTGTYIDTFSYENVIEQDGCKFLSWTLQEQEGSRGSEISLPKTIEFVMNGLETAVNDGARVFKYQKTSYTENSFVIYNRYVLDSPRGVAYSKIEVIKTSDGLIEYQTDNLKDVEYLSGSTNRSPDRSYIYTKVR